MHVLLSRCQHPPTSLDSVRALHMRKDAHTCSSQDRSLRASAGFCIIFLLAGLNAVLKPACAAARPRREQAPAHSGDIVRPSCASGSVREDVEQCYSLRPSASWLRCGTSSPTLLHAQKLGPLCLLLSNHAGEQLRIHHDDV